MANLYVIAGPNGAGKTTFAREFLPHFADCREFVNVDLIAAGISPFAPETAALKAGRLMIERIRELSHQRVDFAFETTLSGWSHLNLLSSLNEEGYLIHLFLLWIPNVELALSRIELRVRNGGHCVPEIDVRRRFERGIRNFFQLYRPLLDSWLIFDNSGDEPKVIAVEREGKLHVIDVDLFEQISAPEGNNE